MNIVRGDADIGSLGATRVWWLYCGTCRDRLPVPEAELPDGEVWHCAACAGRPVGHGLSPEALALAALRCTDPPAGVPPLLSEDERAKFDITDPDTRRRLIAQGLDRLTGTPAVSDRTQRRRTALARMPRHGGEYDPATGTWRRSCPYCHRPFVAQRSTKVTCGRRSCLERHRRRPG